MVRRHLSILIDPATVAELAELRNRFDPDMAAAVPPHLTVAYPEEVSDERLLLDRARHLAGRTGPFLCSLGEVICLDEGRGGVFAAVKVPSGSWSDLRSQLLSPPLEAMEVPAHVTVVHPRTSDRGPEAWAELGGRSLTGEWMVEAIVHTETGGPGRFEVLEELPLVGPGRSICAGVFLVRSGRVLLGRRNRTRESFPGAWDLPGGRIEPGESPRDAASRELAEELGVEATAERFTFVTSEADGEVELVVYATAAWTGEPSNFAPEEHDDLGWFSPREMEDLALSDDRLVAAAARAVGMVRPTA